MGGGSLPLRCYWLCKYAPTPSAGGFHDDSPPQRPEFKQFASVRDLRLPRLSALRLLPGRCSLGSAIRTVYQTVQIPASLCGSPQRPEMHHFNMAYPPNMCETGIRQCGRKYMQTGWTTGLQNGFD